jgi:hypothetical protein
LKIIASKLCRRTIPTLRAKPSSIHLQRPYMIISRKKFLRDLHLSISPKIFSSLWKKAEDNINDVGTFDDMFPLVFGCMNKGFEAG